MKRTTIEFMIGWLDGLRRDDVEALRAAVTETGRALIGAVREPEHAAR